MFSPLWQKFPRLGALACALSLLVASPSWGQVFVPYTLNPKLQDTEEQAISLAREAAQLAQFDRYELALPRALLAVRLAPNSYQAQGILGLVYLRKEKYAEAVATLQLANSLRSNEPGILFTLGSAYLRKGVYGDAIRTLEQGLAISPSSTSALFDLANALFLSKRYEEAIARYNRILELDNRFWAATNNIGLVEYERGNKERAIKLWEESLVQAQQIEFAAAEPMLALGVAHFTMGDRAKGIKLAEEAMKIDPRYGQIPHLVENLWGERLIADTRPLLAVPSVKKLIEEGAKLQPVRRR
ncbi:MAG: tetratricopeptide repeat protein [Pseudanabaenaceae cyanobacterium]